MLTPLFLQMKGETGLETLIGAGQLITTSHLPEITTWVDLTDTLNWILESDPAYKTLVIDALSGGRASMPRTCLPEGFRWRLVGQGLYGLYVRLRSRPGRLASVPCPTGRHPTEGPDYDRFQPDVTPKTWSLTHKWADAVLFWNFEVQVAQVQENRKAQTKKGKLISSLSRRVCGRVPRLRYAGAEVAYVMFRSFSIHSRM